MDRLKAAGLIVIISYLSKLIFFDQNIYNNDEEDSDEEMELYLHRLKVRINNAATKPHRVEDFIERVVDMSTASEFQSHFRITMTMASKSNSSFVTKYTKSWTSNYRSKTTIARLFVAISNTREFSVTKQVIKNTKY